MTVLYCCICNGRKLNLQQCVPMLSAYVCYHILHYFKLRVSYLASSRPAGTLYLRSACSIQYELALIRSTVKEDSLCHFNIITMHECSISNRTVNRTEVPPTAGHHICIYFVFISVTNTCVKYSFRSLELYQY